MPADDYGVFEPVFQSPHGYLELLHLSTSNAVSAVWLVCDCCTDRSAQNDIFSLLSEQNWRPTLVGTVASFFVPADEKLIARLWSQIDRGSWVIPQIAVALARLDPDFEDQCRRRLEAHCPSHHSEPSATAALEQNSPTAPSGTVSRSAKAATTLAWLAGRISPTPAWLQPVLDTPEHWELAASDRDRAETIAERWHDRITAILREISFQ